MNSLGRCAVSLCYKSCLVVGGYIETTGLHFQLPNKNNMFGSKRNKLFYSCFNTVNSDFICTKTKPSKMYCIFLPTMMQLHLLCSMKNVFVCFSLSCVCFSVNLSPVEMFFYWTIMPLIHRHCYFFEWLFLSLAFLWICLPKLGLNKISVSLIDKISILLK